MTEIEKIKCYIARHKAPIGPRYDANFREVRAMAHQLETVEAIVLAFTYGRAKGYQAAKAEVER